MKGVTFICILYISKEGKFASAYEEKRDSSQIIRIDKMYWMVRMKRMNLFIRYASDLVVYKRNVY